MVIEVRDTGVGIDPALLPKIFDLSNSSDPKSLDRNNIEAWAIISYIMAKSEDSLTLFSENVDSCYTLNADNKIISSRSLTNDEKIVMKAPDFSTTAVLSLLYGATIIELDAEMDSRTQYKAVKAKTWDMASQTLAEADGEEPEGHAGRTEIQWTL